MNYRAISQMKLFDKKNPARQTFKLFIHTTTKCYMELIFFYCHIKWITKETYQSKNYNFFEVMSAKHIFNNREELGHQPIEKMSIEY